MNSYWWAFWEFSFWCYTQCCNKCLYIHISFEWILPKGGLLPQWIYAFLILYVTHFISLAYSNLTSTLTVSVKLLLLMWTVHCMLPRPMDIFHSSCTWLHKQHVASLTCLPLKPHFLICPSLSCCSFPIFFVGFFYLTKF